MSDDITAPTEVDTPDNATPENEGAAGTNADTQQETDWQKRYSDLQPEYTRASQEAAELRQQNQAMQVLLYSEDPEQRQLAAEMLGMELGEPESDEGEDSDDPNAQLMARLERLEQDREQSQQQAQFQQQVQQETELINAQLDELQTRLGRDLSEREWKALARAAYFEYRNDQGEPDVQSAWTNEFEPIYTDAEQRLLSGKRNTPAPTGTPANKHVDLSNPQERRAHMIAQLGAAEQQ